MDQYKVSLLCQVFPPTQLLPCSSELVACVRKRHIGSGVTDCEWVTVNHPTQIINSILKEDTSSTPPQRLTGDLTVQLIVRKTDAAGKYRRSSNPK